MFRVVVEVPRARWVKSEKDAAKWVAEAIGGNGDGYWEWEHRVKPFTKVVAGLGAHRLATLDDIEEHGAQQRAP